MWADLVRLTFMSAVTCPGGAAVHDGYGVLGYGDPDARDLGSCSFSIGLP